MMKRWSLDKLSRSILSGLSRSLPMKENIDFTFIGTDSRTRVRLGLTLPNGTGTGASLSLVATPPDGYKESRDYWLSVANHLSDMAITISMTCLTASEDEMDQGVNMTSDSTSIRRAIAGTRKFRIIDGGKAEKRLADPGLSAGPLKTQLSESGLDTVWRSSSKGLPISE